MILSLKQSWKLEKQIRQDRKLADIFYRKTGIKIDLKVNSCLQLIFNSRHGAGIMRIPYDICPGMNVNIDSWMIELNFRNHETGMREYFYSLIWKKTPYWKIRNLTPLYLEDLRGETIQLELGSDEDRLTLLEFIKKYDCVAEARLSIINEYSQKIMNDRNLTDKQKIHYLKKLYDKSYTIFHNGIKPDMKKLFLD